MGDDNNRPGIVKPEIGNDVEFEINSNFMRELRRKILQSKRFRDEKEKTEKFHAKRIDVFLAVKGVKGGGMHGEVGGEGFVEAIACERDGEELVVVGEIGVFLLDGGDGGDGGRL
ncbi:hypothetical protein Tco_1417447 [Tanacetum coccineum]